MTKKYNPNDDHIYWGREKPKVDDLPLFSEKEEEKEEAKND